MVADPVRTPANRIVQGLLLLAGAGLLEFAVGGDRIAFHWTPLILGLTYLVAALVDGPRGGYRATALAIALGAAGIVNVVAGAARLRPGAHAAT